ncbi:MAG: hypothetical protein KI790_17860 [Cyclobacteriaceae bacterium]|nr:hypothetical protein [Cyclobacteriaceae bacterium HetDA_MAG_MS6]
MKKIWDKQNNEPMYAINENTLIQMIRSRISKSNFFLKLYDVAMIGSSFFVAILLIGDTWFHDESPIQYIPAGVAIILGIYMLVERSRRKRKEQAFSQSLLDSLDQAIWSTAYLIRKAETIMLWYVLPLFGALAISVWLMSEKIWVVICLAIVALFSYFGILWELKRWHRPRKKALIHLKTILMQE